MGAGVTAWKKKRGAGAVRCFAAHHPGSFKDLGIQKLHPCGDKVLERLGAKRLVMQL